MQSNLPVLSFKKEILHLRLLVCSFISLLQIIRGIKTKAMHCNCLLLVLSSRSLLVKVLIKRGAGRIILLHLSDRCLCAFVFRKSTDKALFELPFICVASVLSFEYDNKAQSYKTTKGTYCIVSLCNFLMPPLVKTLDTSSE